MKLGIILSLSSKVIFDTKLYINIIKQSYLEAWPNYLDIKAAFAFFCSLVMNLLLL